MEPEIQFKQIWIIGSEKWNDTNFWKKKQTVDSIIN